MDVVILCGGKGTRISEETAFKPKPMVKIGGMPILWHIMKLYSYYGCKRFILALGYKHEIIMQYFCNLRNTNGDLLPKVNSKVDLDHFYKVNDWEIIFADTGQDTLKGGRIKRIEKHLISKSFHLTYGDGVSNININDLWKFHQSHNCLGTVTAVRPPSRFGELKLDEDNVLDIQEKPQMGQGYINGGYFVFNREMLNYLSTSKSCDFEFGPLQKISRDGGLKAFKHEGFWQCMDNVRERDYLDKLIAKESAPWMVW